MRNAIQYTPTEGHITVSCSVGTISQVPGEWLITHIQDTGSGIAAEDIPLLFERFYRADRARQRETGGRSLGLAIVRDYVRLHGGHVWVESELGHGSTFSFALPPKRITPNTAHLVA